MKGTHFSKKIALIALVLASLVLLTACSSEEAPSVQILVGNSFVAPESFESCTQQLTDDHPSWQEKEAQVEFTSTSFGNPDNDLYAGANVAKVMTMIAANEVDLFICDTENAARFARGEMFAPLEDLLSEEELTDYQDRLLTFEKVDEQGNLTGEYMQPCGIALNGNEALDAIYGEEEYGVFFVSNADPQETCKEIFLDLANG